MSSDRAKKRQRTDGEASDNVVLEMEAMFDRKLRQMEEKMQRKFDAMAEEVHRLKGRLSRVDELEGRCKFLEEKCAAMGRSLDALARRWEFSAPDIPADHWTARGFGADYVEFGVDLFAGAIEGALFGLKNESGRRNIDIELHAVEEGGVIDDEGHRVLLHDDALLPYWQNLADALDLYSGHSLYTFSVSGIQLSPKVLQLLVPSLIAMKGIHEIGFKRNSFPRPRDGVEFAVRIVECMPQLTTFDWTHNSLHTTDSAITLVEALKRHPSIQEIYLENCCGDNVDGYRVLTALLSETRSFTRISIGGNSIQTRGATHISDYLAANTALGILTLESNRLNDDDAILIANALRQNTNLDWLRHGFTDMTDVGRRALENAVFDGTSLNSAADSNHTCTIEEWMGAYGDYTTGEADGVDNLGGTAGRRRNRRKKVYHVLSSRNELASNVQHLDSEVGDDSLKLVPLVLRRVKKCARNGHSRGAVPPLSIFYELLRGWKMPSLCEQARSGHKRCNGE